MDRIKDFKSKLNDYKKFATDQYWSLDPEYEGDILYVTGVRDEIHDLYDGMAQSEKELIRADIEELIMIDRTWQEKCKESQSPDFKQDKAVPLNHKNIA